MGNNMGRHQVLYLVNATSRSFSHELRDLWNSARGTVLRIETLALVAMVLSFFLAAFGSCRRKSNSWFIQKGFLAANALFLSLGTYTIGLMQSSQVKSEMYPLWAVSLLALLCCVDSAAASSLDSRSQLWKMLYQLCLYFGYVLLLSISTISSDIGNRAICLLAAVTFFKGFHRSMALVLPSSMRNMVKEIPKSRQNFSFMHPDEEKYLLVDAGLDIMTTGHSRYTDMGGMASVRFQESRLESELNACKDMCVSLSLSHLLHRRFLGLNSVKPTMDNRGVEPLVKNYERALKLVETELAFLYDVLYTSNAFLHYYEARSASIWAFASLIGICFVGTTVVVVPRARATPRHASSPGNTFVDTTVLQLLRCWTSNWAKVSFARDCKRISRYRNDELLAIKNEDLSWGMRLRASLIKIDWSDKYQYLWQNKLGQHSLMESITVAGSRDCGGPCFSGFPSNPCLCFCLCFYLCFLGILTFSILKVLEVFGLQYIRREVREMFRGSCSIGGGAIEFHADVKASIGDFVSEKIRGDEISGWASSKVESNSTELGGLFLKYVPELRHRLSTLFEDGDDDEVGVPCILMWHIASCYCQHAQQQQQHDDDSNGGFSQRMGDNKKNHGVAMALSKYCAYLVVSAPRLLPGRSDNTKKLYAGVRDVAIWSIKSTNGDKLQAMESFDPSKYSNYCSDKNGFYSAEYRVLMGSAIIYEAGVVLGKGLQSMPAADRWEMLAEFWVKALLYAAPSDKAEEHMQHLAQGGELITHLWALLYHAGVHRWHLDPPQAGQGPVVIKMGWDYIFRIRSWKDLNPPAQGQAGIQQSTGEEVIIDVVQDDDGASSSSQPPPSHE
ncbi:hypothetical protein C2845_PM05G02560 [Panicum miliaceum]|uniref:DUF4220 domain-containing protein n=1 Tax=Panicum miliaceum TaxID=4540 RepID=A0A3L6SYD9_PANMI|nr:hypothetical protein C2845_PM05G02560 [Panicum miliaceum]